MRTTKTHRSKCTAGNVSVESMTAAVMVGLAGIVGLGTLGVSFTSATAGDAKGQRVKTASQAAHTHEGGGAIDAHVHEDNMPTTEPPARASSQGGEIQSGLDHTATTISAAQGASSYEPEPQGGERHCGTFDLLCKGTRWLSERAGSLAGNSWGDKLGFLRGIGRGLIGAVDGISSGLTELVTGVAKTVKSVVWDFLVEDVIAGTARGVFEVGKKLTCNGDHCDQYAWNPFDSATDSLLHFGKNVVPGAKIAVSEISHHVTGCLNAANHNAALDRGYSCGLSAVRVLDVVFGGKVVSNAAKASKARLGSTLAKTESARVAKTTTTAANESRRMRFSPKGIVAEVAWQNALRRANTIVKKARKEMGDDAFRNVSLAKSARRDVVIALDSAARRYGRVKNQPYSRLNDDLSNAIAPLQDEVVRNATGAAEYVAREVRPPGRRAVTERDVSRAYDDIIGAVISEPNATRAAVLAAEGIDNLKAFARRHNVPDSETTYLYDVIERVAAEKAL